MVQTGDNAPIRMIPISGSRFWGPMWLRVPLRFEFGSGGDAQRLIIERPWPDDAVVLEKIDGNDPVDRAGPDGASSSRK